MDFATSTAEALDERVPGELIATSKGTPWRDLFVQMFTRRPVQDSLLIPAVPEPLIVWVVSGAALVEERPLEGEWMGNEVREGDFFLQTSPLPCELRWRTLTHEPFRVMHVYLGLPLIRRAVIDVYGPEAANVQLREISGGTDTVITHQLGILRDELVDRRTPSSMLVQGLASSLAVHLVRSYASEAPASAAPHGGLPAFKMHRVLQAMQERLDQELDLSRLAREVQLSDSHFSRCFKKSTGFSPSQYLTRLRMERARRLLRETEMPIVEVGLEVGYASPSHFAQVFRKEVGVLPSDYRSVR
ncbi:AraC family transcriptional regulator [Aquincola tertiaricarbonis]|uniref:AraC family transcriptional regulator n=1 Tax=Aquincola tertiaricarbonis TaxID=391953 RepID=UPI00061541FD|nr:AraC family transcriptional regulator [Aquincola tertiaricarbonis]